MTQHDIRQLLSRDEIRQLTRRSDAAGWFAVGSTWAVIAGTFLALARWPHPLTILAALVVLGGRQLALAILMHEAAHRTLFRRTVLNDTLANWLCAKPIWNDVALYKRHHLRHHTHTGTELDPDISLAPTSPTTRRSLARKFARDLAGITGLKRLFGQVLMASEVIEYTVTPEVKRRPANGRTWRDYLGAFAKNSSGFVLTNGALAACLTLCGELWIFGIWALAYLTTFSLFIRIRSLAEHACTARTSDPFLNTRTTRAGWLARMTVAPFCVNYHLEHHLLIAVPWYRLAELHRRLRNHGVVSPAPGYRAVLAAVSSAAR